MLKLRSKILLLTLTPLLAAAVFLTVFNLAVLKDELEDAFQLRTLTLTRAFLNVSLDSRPQDRLRLVRNFLDSLSADPDLEEAHLLDENGTPLISKFRGNPREGFRLDPALFQKAVDSFAPQSVFTEENGGRHKVLYQKVWSEGPEGIRLLGVISLKLSLRRIDADIRRSLMTHAAVAVVFTMLAIPLSLLFSVRIIRPLERLRAATKKLGAGDFAISLPTDARDEVGDLARDFQRMAGDIQSGQAQLLSHEKLVTLGQMAGGVAHDVKSPLSTVVLYVVEVRKMIPPEEKTAAAFLDVIEREVRRCIDFIQNILIFSHNPDAEIRVELDLNAVVQDALTLVASQSKVKGVDLVRELAPGPLPIRANKGQIQEVVINLCGNAMDAMEGRDGGAITVRTSREGTDSLLLEVADTGPGVPPEIMPRIFEPFFTTKAKENGTGLGLAMVHEIVRLHGGEVRVRNIPGGGASFVVRIPAASPFPEKQ